MKQLFKWLLIAAFASTLTACGYNDFQSKDEASKAAWAEVVNQYQRALDLFARYRVWDTEENCGVLLYLNLADRKLEIVADRGVAGQIGNDDWNAVCQTMTQGFAQDEFHHSSLAALAQLNALLASHYPAGSERVNQLSDKPILL